MKDPDKTRAKPAGTLVEQRRRIAELEALEAELKRTEQELREAREYAECIVETVREPLVLLDADLRVISTNRSFCETFNRIFYWFVTR